MADDVDHMGPEEFFLSDINKSESYMILIFSNINEPNDFLSFNYTFPVHNWSFKPDLNQ